MHLADRGLVTQVQELLKYPVQQCPDFLSLGLLQANQPMTLFKQELLCSLIPIFLANHANSAVILHHIWHNQVNNILQINVLFSYSLIDCVLFNNFRTLPLNSY